MNKNILIADDDVDILDAYNEIFFIRKDYNIKLFENGLDLLTHFYEENRAGNKIPLCILDMRMPLMSGLETAEQIRKTDPDVIILIVTGYSGDISVDKLMESLEEDIYYIEKPFRYKEFCCLVDSLVKGWNKNQNLKDNKEKYRSIFNNITDVYYEVTLDGTILEASPSIEELSQYKREEFIGTSIYDIYASPEDRDKLIQIFKKEKRVRDYEITMKNKEGRHIPCSINAMLCTDENGKYEKIIGSMRDINERKKAEKELIRLVTALEQTADCVIMTDRDGKIEYVNPMFCKTTGYTREEVLGKTPNILKSGRQNKKFYEKMWDTITKGEVWSGHIINRKKDGTLFEEDASISPIIDSKGKITNYVAVNRDITEKIKMESHLRQSQKLEAIGTLAGGIAHDFNNILVAILGYTEVALYEVPEGSITQRNLKQVRKACKRAINLIKQILAFSRKSEPIRKPVRVNIMAKETLKLLRPLLPSTIEIKQEIDEKSGYILADPTQIHQIIMNLATNAAHAMRKKRRYYGN